MKTSEQGIQFLKNAEGIILKTYNDIYGNATWGYGFLNSLIPIPNWQFPITEKICDAVLRSRITLDEIVINKNFPNLTQNQFDALVSIRYNTGNLTEIYSKLLNKTITRDDIITFRDKNQALQNRRIAEADLYFKGIYK